MPIEPNSKGPDILNPVKQAMVTFNEDRDGSVCE